MELESQVGREWTCKEGVRRVLGVRQMKDGRRYLECSPSHVRYGETEIRHVFMGGGNDLIPSVEELDRMIAIDERNAIDHAEWQKAEAIRLEAEAAAKAEREDLDGFGSERAPIARQKLVETLNRELRYNGRVMTRKAFIRSRVAQGDTVEIRYGSRVLMSPEGSWFPEASLTRTELDYAAYLIAKRQTEQLAVA